MALAIGNTSNFIETVSSTSHSSTLTLGSSNSRKIIVIATKDQTISCAITGATFDGNAMTNVASVSHSAAADYKLAMFYYDVPDGTSSGSKTVTVTTSANSADITWYAWELTGAATGAPEYGSTSEASSAASTISRSGVTVSEGAACVAMVSSASALVTTNSWTVLTERLENNETNYTSAVADASGLSAGTNTVTVTWSGTNGTKLLGVISVAAASVGGALSITSVTPSTFDDGTTGIVVAGSGFGASQGASTLTIGGQAQTVTAWSDTSITFTCAAATESSNKVMGTQTLTLVKG